MKRSFIPPAQAGLAAPVVAWALTVVSPASACKSTFEVVAPFPVPEPIPGTDLPIATTIPGPWSFLRSLDGVSGYNSDCRPTMNRDGTLVLFEASANGGPPYDPVNHSSEHFHIYEMRWDGIQWTGLHALDPSKFTEHNYPSLSADGSRLFTTFRGQIHVSDRVGSSWSDPSPLRGAINALLPGEENVASHVNEAGDEIYFASNRSGGFGGKDIWVCRLRGDFTDSLTNLGPGVNSQGIEARPAVSPSGRYLLFSDFGGGRPTMDFGGVDLYICEFVNGRWSTAVPVPAPVNNYKPICTSHWVSDTELILGGGGCEGGWGNEDLWVTTIGASGASSGLPSLRPTSARDRRVAAGLSSAHLRRDPRRTGPRGEAAGAAAIRPPGRWTRLVDLPGARIVEDLFETSTGILLASTSDRGGIYRSDDGGETWVRIGLGPGVSRVFSFVETSRHTVLVGTYPHGTVFESEDFGATWTALAPLPEWVTSVRAILELRSGDLLVGVNPDTVQGGPTPNQGRVFRSEDRGISWRQSASLDSVAAGVLALYQQGGGVVWAGTRGYRGRIHKSTDDGRTWSTVPMRFPVTPSLASIYRFFEDSTGQLWCMGWAHGESGAFLARLAGESAWFVDAPFERDGGYRDGFTYDLVEDDRGWFFAGTQPSNGSPAWVSTDRGSTWHPTAGLGGAREVLTLLATRTGRVLAGTSGDGAIWEWRPTVEIGER